MNTFFILDFDRCMGNTEGIQEVLESVMKEELGVSTEDFRTARAQMEGEGKTFTTIRHVHVLLERAGSTKTWEDIKDALIRKAQGVNLLLPFAKDLISALDERSLPYGIVTYGAEEAWQLIKLEITGLLSIPHLVTRIETKGELLTGWKQEDGTFIVPPALSKDFVPRTVAELVLIDDKAKSFWGIPPGVRGVHVIAPGGNTLPAQQGELPPHVTDVTGLDGAIRFLFDQS